jgi:glutathione S-transferase
MKHNVSCVCQFIFLSIVGCYLGDKAAQFGYRGKSLFSSFVHKCAKAFLLCLLSQFKNVDFDKSEHMTAEFRQMNPLHQVPVLDDGNGFFITDSHAIISYLATNTNLSSTDPRILARINQLLYFDFEVFRVMGDVGVSSNL